MAAALDVAGVLIPVLLILWLRARRSSAMRLPPGPKKLPVLGNLLDMPTERPWLKFAAWGNQYGNLVSVSILGQPYIIVNSAQVAIEMLDKKSRIYSDRPTVQMCGELMGWKDTLGFLPYGQRFRNYRRMFRQAMGTYDAINKFRHVEEMETRRFLQRVQTKPEELESHIRKTAGAIILRIVYGYEVVEGDDPFVSAVTETMEQFSLSFAQGAFLVDLVPSLRYLPEWLPGAGFKQTARAWRQTLYETVDGPYNFVRKQMDLGTAEPSMVSNLLKSSFSESNLDEIKWASASVYGGGADTSVATIYSFYKAMVLYPDVQAQAQSEIDDVIGNNRLPTMEDRKRLPFVSALVTEALRWHTVGPTGIPHRVMEDDIHDGYLIPRGALIIPNIWQMAHDPSVYKDPMEFNPSRFIKTESHEPEPDPRKISFGFGRRLCPGLLLADISVFISCAMCLAVFNITPHIENGMPVMPDLTQSTGAISHPSKFKCTIVPRTQKALALINAVDLPEVASLSISGTGSKLDGAAQVQQETRGGSSGATNVNEA